MDHCDKLEDYLLSICIYLMSLSALLSTVLSRVYHGDIHILGAEFLCIDMDN